MHHVTQLYEQLARAGVCNPVHLTGRVINMSLHAFVGGGGKLRGISA